MKNSKIISKPNEAINWDKTRRDLDLIKSLDQLSKANNWHIVVSGGYGLDILLGQITRTHNDIDLIIYGQSDRSKASTIIQEYLANHTKNATIKISENDFMVDLDFNSPGLGADIYYVQIAESPFTNLSVVIKQTGEHITNSKKRFPPPVMGKLNELEIDVQNPHTHLADILFKQRTKTHKPTHDQDIANLRQITDPVIVDEILSLS